MPDTRTPPRQIAVGLALTALSAVSFGVVTSFANLAYAGGSNPVSLVLIRGALAVLVGLGLALALKRPFTVPGDARPALLGTSVAVIMASLCYLSAVERIPVSLAVLLFYTFPLLVLLSESALARKWPSPRAVLAVAIAFGGLVLALGPSIDSLDWSGVGLALAAAVGAGATVQFSARVSGKMSLTTLTFYTHLFGLPIAFALLRAFDGFTLPYSDTGWTGLVAASVFYVGGICFLYAATRFAEPTLAAMVYNLEPLVTMVAGVVILGELLSPIQYLGGFFVLLGVYTATLRGSRADAPEAGTAG